MQQDSRLLQQTLMETAAALSTTDGASAETMTGLKEQVITLIGHLRAAMFPQIFGDAGDAVRHSDICLLSLQNAAILLRRMLEKLLPDSGRSEALTAEYLSGLPGVRSQLLLDVEAAYEGDPAAKSTEEIMLTYPAFEAISIYRLAHRLNRMDVPILPRMMTEYAHRITGIDIHPGASIGSYFFIDHGTGVVIGETTTIGDHVKLYQGVTLGAKSFDVAPDGSLVKGVKRHPDLGNRVVVYAGATILGGSTVIGDDCVIGGNVWITHSVPAGQTVIAIHSAPSAANRSADD